MSTQAIHGTHHSSVVAASESSANAAAPARLLIVDDDPQIRDLFSQVAMRAGCEVRVAGDGDEFWKQYEDFHPQALILDLVMSGTDGIALMRQLHEKGSRPTILLISGSDSRMINAAERLGEGWNLPIQASIRKPVSVPDLERILQQTFASRTVPDRSALADGLGRGEIVPFFQPKVSLGSEMKVTSLEILARWKHPRLGTLHPADFIATAEEAGLIQELTISLLDQALPLIQRCRDKGVEVDLSLNLSRMSLADSTFPKQIAETIERHRAEHGLLTLELDEKTVSGLPPEAHTTLGDLHARGFHISMDDFGSGNASLLDLIRLPLSELKIDRSLTCRLGQKRDSEILVRSAIALADSLGIKACAVGVETRRALTILQDAGAHSIQGTLVSEPIPGTYLSTIIPTWEKRVAGR